jgi:uncharacterized protein (TIGR03437 family)
MIEVHRLVVEIEPALSGGNARSQGAILHAGTANLVSADNPGLAGELLEDYCNGLIDEGVIPPQVSIGGRVAEALSFGSTAGFVDLNQVTVRLPRGVPPGLEVACS